MDEQATSEELVSGLGMVLDQERGSLPYSLILGEPLVRCAALALEAAGLRLVDPDTPWETVDAWLAGTGVLVLHDALCPLVPPEFLAECAARAAGSDLVVVAVRPVTDTVKQVADGVVGGTLDRADLRILASPVVVPAGRLGDLSHDRTGPVHDLPTLVATLVDRGVPVEWAAAPTQAARVSGPEDVRLLEALASARA